MTFNAADYSTSKERDEIGEQIKRQLEIVKQAHANEVASIHADNNRRYDQLKEQFESAKFQVQMAKQTIEKKEADLEKKEQEELERLSKVPTTAEAGVMTDAPFEAPPASSSRRSSSAK